MPREITDRGRVVEAVQRLALTAELFEEQNGKQKYAADLEVIVQGRDYGNGKRVGPYVRLLAYDGGEEIMREGEWGGNTFYIAVAGPLDVYVGDNGGRHKVNVLEPGTCFGEMALLAGIERNATVAVPANQTAVVLEVSRPALRLLRKLPKFGQILDETYRTHGFARVLDDFARITDKPLSQRSSTNSKTPRVSWSTARTTSCVKKTRRSIASFLSRVAGCDGRAAFRFTRLHRKS